MLGQESWIVMLVKGIKFIGEGRSEGYTARNKFKVGRADWVRGSLLPRSWSLFDITVGQELYWKCRVLCYSLEDPKQVMDQLAEKTFHQVDISGWTWTLNLPEYSLLIPKYKVSNNSQMLGVIPKSVVINTSERDTTANSTKQEWGECTYRHTQLPTYLPTHKYTDRQTVHT